MGTSSIPVYFRDVASNAILAILPDHPGAMVSASSVPDLRRKLLAAAKIDDPGNPVNPFESGSPWDQPYDPNAETQLFPTTWAEPT